MRDAPTPDRLFQPETPEADMPALKEPVAHDECGTCW